MRLLCVRLILRTPLLPLFSAVIREGGETLACRSIVSSYYLEDG